MIGEDTAGRSLWEAVVAADPSLIDWIAGRASVPESQQPDRRQASTPEQGRHGSGYEQTAKCGKARFVLADWAVSVEGDEIRVRARTLNSRDVAHQGLHQAAILPRE